MKKLIALFFILLFFNTSIPGETLKDYVFYDPSYIYLYKKEGYSVTKEVIRCEKDKIEIIETVNYEKNKEKSFKSEYSFVFDSGKVISKSGDDFQYVIVGAFNGKWEHMVNTEENGKERKVLRVCETKGPIKRNFEGKERDSLDVICETKYSDVNPRVKAIYIKNIGMVGEEFESITYTTSKGKVLPQSTKGTWDAGDILLERKKNPIPSSCLGM